MPTSDDDAARTEGRIRQPRRASPDAATAPVEVRAHSFERFGRPLGAAEIRVLERPDLRADTDEHGRAQLELPHGQRATFVLRKPRYQATQAAQVVVPSGGLTGEAALTFQIPFALTFRVLQRLFAIRPQPDTRHVATTVTARGKTLADPVQGEPGAIATLERLEPERGTRIPGAGSFAPIYLGIIPGVHKTDFLRPALARSGWGQPLRATSADGGVLFADVPLGRYRLRAHKPGLRFSSCEFTVRPDSPALINVSPPYGPRVLP